ncbi:MAG: hypothetical protein L0228_06645 [Planctomycetes bacterium]|nr:hypothetical protein [Planctomycetota bacterium]
MRFLIATAVAQAVLYGAIAWLSSAFAYGTNEQERPILPMLGLFAATFVLYLAAVRTAVRCPITRHLGWVIVASAVLFRCILLPTDPIQEIDIYRYLWDGAVSARGLNPYRFAPAQVLAAESQMDSHDELRSLVEIRDSSPAIAEVLGRVHYADLTTVYPPVSQAVFALGDRLTPRDATVNARVIILKAVLSIFDVATIALVWLLLRVTAKHPGWAVAYAWCPLVMKEYAVSGHFDSIAVFFATAAVYCVVRQRADYVGKNRVSWVVAGAVLLSLAIGAKLYAIVLIPVLCAAIAARARLAIAAMFAAAAALCTAACLLPMLVTMPANNSPSLVVQSASASSPDPVTSEAATYVSDAPTASSGLKAFVAHWEMNDFLFMLLVENIRPTDPKGHQPEVWFAVTPDAWREAVTTPVARLLATNSATAAFFATRILTSCLFLAIAIALAWRACRAKDIAAVVEAAFLTLAWFWLLSPTQNPWYWTWALPLLPFARGRAWYAMSGLVMLYYLRFWLQYQFPDGPVLGIGYTGTQFFDFVVTWLEYAPWFVWLGIAAWLRRYYAASDPLENRTCVGGFTEINDESTYHTSRICNQKEPN